mgnify:CR=1 FL=1
MSTLAIVGCGTMGRAVAAGLANRPNVLQLAVVTARSRAACEQLGADLGVEATPDNAAAIAQADQDYLDHIHCMVCGRDLPSESAASGSSERSAAANALRMESRTSVTKRFRACEISAPSGTLAIAPSTTSDGCLPD